MIKSGRGKRLRKSLAESSPCTPEIEVYVMLLLHYKKKITLEKGELLRIGKLSLTRVMGEIGSCFEELRWVVDGELLVHGCVCDTPKSEAETEREKK